MARHDKNHVLCIEYVTQGGSKVIGRSKPTTYKAAHRKRKEYLALGKGERVWVERVDSIPNPFKLVVQ
jgi:hypothetical protein